MYIIICKCIHMRARLSINKYIYIYQSYINMIIIYYLLYIYYTSTPPPSNSQKEDYMGHVDIYY